MGASFSGERLGSDAAPPSGEASSRGEFSDAIGLPGGFSSCGPGCFPDSLLLLGCGGRLTCGIAGEPSRPGADEEEASEANALSMQTSSVSALRQGSILWTVSVSKGSRSKQGRRLPRSSCAACREAKTSETAWPGRSPSISMVRAGMQRYMQAGQKTKTLRNRIASLPCAR